MIKIGSLIKGLLRPRFEKVVGAALYESCVIQSRQPVFYTQLGVEDQKGARFEMLNLHIALMVNHLRRISDDNMAAQAKDTAQALFDHYLLALDNGLREDGVGDLSVPKKMKKLSALIYTRFKAWDALLPPDVTDASIVDYLSRTVYAGTALDPNYNDEDDVTVFVAPSHVAAMAAYVRAVQQSLSPTALLEAKTDWPQPSLNLA
jgi:cytochrome b pre-mRNA-processing protein 3